MLHECIPDSEKGEALPASGAQSLSESRFRLTASAQSDAVLPGDIPESLCRIDSDRFELVGRIGVDKYVVGHSIPLEGDLLASVLMFNSGGVTS